MQHRLQYLLLDRCLDLPLAQCETPADIGFPCYRVVSAGQIKSHARIVAYQVVPKT